MVGLISHTAQLQGAREESSLPSVNRHIRRANSRHIRSVHSKSVHRNQPVTLQPLWYTDVADRCLVEGRVEISKRQFASRLDERSGRKVGEASEGEGEAREGEDASLIEILPEGCHAGSCKLLETESYDMNESRRISIPSIDSILHVRHLPNKPDMFPFTSPEDTESHSANP